VVTVSAETDIENSSSHIIIPGSLYKCGSYLHQKQQKIPVQFQDGS
jgi:hypothetical protein